MLSSQSIGVLSCFHSREKKALIIGIANEDSIDYGCAKCLHEQGADLAITYLNEKAERYVRPLAEQPGAKIILPLDVRDAGQLDHVFDTVCKIWGCVDICLPSIAFCPSDDLHGRVVDCSRDGFSSAMDISVHSFIRTVRLAEPLMPNGGTCMAVSFYGSEKVVEHYNIMGPAKAALEAATRYMASELGPKRIRLHALSLGPLKTRAASGIDGFDQLMVHATEGAPTDHLATIRDGGAYAAYLASSEAGNITGGIQYIDGGYHIVG